MTRVAERSRVAALNKALDAGAAAAWELEPELAALYLKAIRAQCAIAVRRLTALGEGDRNAGAPVTAAGHAAWTRPDPDELGLQLREQMDSRWETGEPETIRVEAMRRVTEDGLAIFGVSFSTKNPAVRGVLGQLGRKIVGITGTTREDIMRAIDTGWETGLSIPHTAELIRDYSQNIAPARATTIARTELIGAVNGGSHAVASVAQAWGAANGEPPLLKIWLTAEDERVRDSHVQAGEDYAAGAGIPLDDPFAVGDDELQFPGDPDGSAGEVINCRCAISYEEAGDPGGGVSDVSPDAEAIAGEPVPATPAPMVHPDGAPVFVSAATDAWNAARVEGMFASHRLAELDLSVEAKALPTGEGDTIMVSAEIVKNGTGEPIGEMSRFISPSKHRANHADFSLEPAYQGKGIARDLMRSSVAEYDAAGITRVDVLAAGENGKYTWARYGFDFQTEAGLERYRDGFLERAEDDVGILTPQSRARIETAAHAWEFAGMTVEGSGGTITGKELMLSGHGWNGSLDLTPGSAGRRIFDDYVAQK